MKGGMKGRGAQQHDVGVLTQWDSQRACGWVQCGSTGTNYFAHKSEFMQQFPDDAGPPVGMPVSFVPGVDAKSGKMRATCIQPAGGKARKGGHVGMPAPFAIQVPFGYSAPMAMAAPRLRGRLTDWQVAKGCGWVECLDAGQQGQRFFAHKSEFVQQFSDDATPPEGAMVSFVVGTDAKSGKLRCQAIHFERSTFGNPGGGVVQGKQLGKLIEWIAEKGCGWVECKQVAGGKLFAHKTEFKEQFNDGEEPPVGTSLHFVVGVDKKSGKERACAIEVASENAIAGAQFDKWNAVQGGGWIGGGQNEGQQQGQLMEWNSEKGCGWISCMQATGGKLFAHKTEFMIQFDDGEQPPIGTTLRFVVGFDKKSGKERAQSIEVADDSAIGDGRIYGTLDKWNPEKGCGWIESSGNEGKPVFAHKSEFVDAFDDNQLFNGMMVSYVLGVDQKSGKMRALEINCEQGVKRGPPGGGMATNAKRARN